MANHAHSTSTVIPLPGAGPFAGKRSQRERLEQRKQREILLACLEEHQRALHYYANEAASRSQRIAELMAELRALDGYRALDWGPDLRPFSERA